MNPLWKARVKWYNLGLGLGINETILKAIQAHFGDVDSCFREMLSYRLKMADPLSSWEVLVKALAQPSVDCKELASDLAKKHNIQPPPGKYITLLPNAMCSIYSARVKIFL